MNAAVETFRQYLQTARTAFLSRFGRDLVITDRLKVLLGAAAAVLVLSALLGLSSVVDGLERRHTTTQIDLERLKEQIESSSWQERQNQSQVLKSVLAERLWTAQTPGLAEAGFERWLRTRLSTHKMTPQQLQIRRVPVLAQSGSDNDPQPALAGVQRMTVKIIMPFDQAGLLGFLRDISVGEKTLVVDRLVARSGRNARIEMDVSAFYRSQRAGE